MTFDVIVIGLGGMGSATVAHLARRGVRVLGLEQYSLVHHRGSSHGYTRIIRTAYYEHPDYVPLVKRAFTLWHELEQRTGRPLLTPCPCLSIGSADSDLIRGVNRAAAEHGLSVEPLDRTGVMDRYPQFVLDDSHVGVLEHAAGILRVEDCVLAHLDDARATGFADLRAEEPVVEWKRVGSSVEVRTTRGAYSAGALVVTAGAWATRLLSDSGMPLTVMRQVQLWFDPGPALPQFARDRFPVFLIDSPLGAHYGLPAIDRYGLKCARHYGAPELPNPDGVNWDVTEQDDAPAVAFLRRHLPTVVGPRTRGEVCMYTLTPDRHFVIDQLPGSPRISIAAGFSGHGFKFAPTVGEILADLTLTGTTPHRIELFHMGRFRSRVDWVESS
jgi:sarcosine oxidase